MINTEIKIHQLVDTGLTTYYQDFDLDLYENEPIPVNRSYIDVSDVSARKSDHTLTIKLPGTSNNNKAFSNIFRIDWGLPNSDLTQNYYTNFNPTLKADVTLYCNGIVQLKGYLQLLKINVTDEQKIEYECIILGRVANLFSDIGDKNLNDAVVGYSHAYTKANIIASWTATKGEGYVYPLIDYSLTSDEKTYRVDQMYPAVYVKTIVDAIFEDAGYRYESAFFNSTLFKSLIIPYSGKVLRLSDSEITDRTFQVNVSADTSYADVPYYLSPDTLPYNNNVVTASPNGFNTGTHEYTIQTGKNGYYNLYANGIRLHNQLGSPQTASIYAELLVNGVVKSTKLIASFFTANETADINNLALINNIYLNDGDVIKMRIYSNLVATFVEYKLLTTCNFGNVASALYVEGQTINLQDVLPSDVKQTDFLASLFKQFNLFTEVDTLDDHKLIIEPRDDFYTNTLVDLTNYVDVNSGVISEPVGALKYKSYLYKYKEDSDIKNKINQDKYLKPYGFRKFDIINDFVKDEYNTDVIFSPTPLSDRPSVNTRVLSRIWFNDPNQPSTQQSTANIRILYYGGVITPDNAVSWRLLSQTGAYNDYTSYPYAGHLDNPFSPTFDLCFGAPIELQYSASSYTDNNLFNKYHKKGILEIVDPDSRLVTFKLWLNDVLRSQLSFRNYYFIENQYFRLYEVSYDASSPELTTIKFLKLKVAPAFVPTTIQLNGGSTGTGQQGDGNPIYYITNPRNGNSYDSGIDKTVQGENNLISGDKILLNSKNNLINEDYVSIIGGNGNQVIRPGASLVNCSGYVSEIDNEAAVNNIQQPFYHKSELTVYDVSGINTTPLELIPVKYGYWLEVVDAYITLSYGLASVVEFASNKLNLQYSSDTYSLCDFDNGITGSSVAAKQRGVIQTDLQFLEDGVSIHAAGGLGTTGTGTLTIEIFYRLHKKLQ